MKVIDAAFKFGRYEEFDKVAEIGWEISLINSSEGIPIQGFFIYMILLI